MSSVLSDAEREQYARDGYLALDRLVPEEEVDAWLDRAQTLVQHPVEGVRIQVEPTLAAQGVTEATGLDQVRKIEQLVRFDPFFRQAVCHPAVFTRVQELIGEKVSLFRDAFMAKPARHGSAKPYHQDNAYWQVEPMDLCSAWIALDDATIENGCMRLIPGSHKDGPIEHEGGELQVSEDRIDLSREVTAPLHKGGVLLFHSLLLHATSPNRSDRSRRAMIFSYMGGHVRWTGAPEDQPDFIALS